METKDALIILKNVINAGIQKGLFGGIEDVTKALIAIDTVEKALTATPEKPK